MQVVMYGIDKNWQSVKVPFSSARVVSQGYLKLLMNSQNAGSSSIGFRNRCVFRGGQPSARMQGGRVGCMSRSRGTWHSKTAAWIIIIFMLLPFAGILLLNASRYWPFISDDSLISLRYAGRFLEGKGLSWSDGRPVEGYSNLLWVLLVALVGKAGVNLIDAARILGLLGMAAIMFSMLYWYVKKNAFRDVWFPLTVALLFLSLGAPMAVWAIGGLEQPLYGALLAVSIPLIFSVN